MTYATLLTLDCGGEVIQIGNAEAGPTDGGDATAGLRTIYAFAPDIDSDVPTYVGDAWPYVIISGDLSVDGDITADFTTNADGVLLVNGWPAYQYVGDPTSNDANGTFGPWSYFLANGDQSQDACPTVCTASGGAIEFEDGTESIVVCVNDGIPSNVFIDVTENPSDDNNTRWVITDPALNVLGFPATLADVESIDFDNAGTGNCIIWVLNFDEANSNVTELIEAFENDEDVNANDFNGCYDLSNSIEVVRINCGPNFDCEELQANIGEACDDGNENTTDDEITVDCACVGTPVWDCPALEANIGDACDDGNENTDNDTVADNCQCVGTPPVWDCPDLEANFGDACDDGDPLTTNDAVTSDCTCSGTQSNQRIVMIGPYS